MKKGFKRMTAMMLISSLVLVATACGSNDATEGTDEAKATSKIKFMHMYDKNSSQPSHQAELIEQFKAANPDVTFDEEIQSHDNYETKIKTLAAANELPDVFLVKPSMVSTFVENGLLLPLNDQLDKNTAWKEGFNEGVLDPYTIDGKTYGIQMTGGPTHVIYYNKELIANAGFSEFPKTWTEFETLINKLVEQKITPIALGNKGKWVANSSYMSTLGDRFTGTEWFTSLIDNKGAKFTDPEFVQALGALKNLVTIGAFNKDMNSIDNNQQRTLYYNGKAAMFIEGNWAVTAIETSAPKEIIENTAVAVFPAIEGAKGDQNSVSGGGGWAYAVNTNIDPAKLDNIQKLIQSVTDSEAAKLMLKYGDIPSSKVENIEGIELTPISKDLLKLLETTKYSPIYDTRLSPALTEAMNTILQEMMIDKYTPEQAAEVLQKEYDNEMK
ncbi:extracellular solute-binding protein [Paenibacillus glacialis]|uniref:ABC transporter substrate-binding protein n=1 Tax=Paenibacillus glacialis TaxID=494026 RepID=A0A168C1K6_9BACL|nr:extracellular solute-binding protein [Paenibacillus glacialis]OAB32966.1 ABC transporter substrate-binding protein [Paenibacillus glacialis]